MSRNKCRFLYTAKTSITREKKLKTTRKFRVDYLLLVFPCAVKKILACARTRLKVRGIEIISGKVVTLPVAYTFFNGSFKIHKPNNNIITN